MGGGKTQLINMRARALKNFLILQSFGLLHLNNTNHPHRNTRCILDLESCITNAEQPAPSNNIKAAFPKHIVVKSIRGISTVR